MSFLLKTEEVKSRNQSTPFKNVKSLITKFLEIEFSRRKKKFHPFPVWLRKSFYIRGGLERDLNHTEN